MTEFKRVHIIAVGGAVMHNMAIALKLKGVDVTGSDDAIYNPSRANLEKHGLLPKEEGWNLKNVHAGIDAIIVGMHARPDNPELIKARELGIPCYSFPEFMFLNSQQAKRVVVAGSHGKTTITSMLLHCFKQQNQPFNYLVGSKIQGFDCMVGFDNQAKVAIFEGDEYLSSPLDNRSKFLHYKPHVVIITGIAWDHINVFPKYSDYLHTFEKLIRDIQPGGSLIYYAGDSELQQMVAKRPNPSIRYIPYTGLEANISGGYATLKNRLFQGQKLPFFGAHNIANAESARLAMQELGVSGEDFYVSLANFQGAARRLQRVFEKENTTVYYDFAHAPSKVAATVKAVRKAFPNRKMFACLELHTFSSINKDFIPYYKGSMDGADKALVFYDPKVLEHKKMPPLAKEEVIKAFDNKDISIENDKSAVYNFLQSENLENSVVLLMSSGVLFEEYVKQLNA